MSSNKLWTKKRNNANRQNHISNAYFMNAAEISSRSLRLGTDDGGRQRLVVIKSSCLMLNHNMAQRRISSYHPMFEQKADTHSHTRMCSTCTYISKHNTSLLIRNIGSEQYECHVSDTYTIFHVMNAEFFLFSLFSFSLSCYVFPLFSISFLVHLFVPNEGLAAT